MLQEHPALRQHPLEKILETYQLDIRAVLIPKFRRMGGTDLNPQGYMDYSVERWEVSCWPKRISESGLSVREAVSNLLKKLDNL